MLLRQFLSLYQMNILGLVFPASLFQQTNPSASPEKADLKTKCSSAADIFRPSENKVRDAHGMKCQKHASDPGCSKKSSCYLNERIGQLTDIVRASDTPLTLSRDDEPAKRTSKEKKKKKGKSKALLQLDYDIASETADVSKISNSTELAECEPSNGALCNQTAKEVISKSVQDKASESTLNSDRLNHFLDTADTECLTSIKKSSSEITTLQHLASINKTVNGTHHIKVARKQEKLTGIVQNSSNMTASSASEPISVFLKDARDKCRSTDTYEDGSNGISFAVERSGVSQNKVAADTNSYFRSFLADSRACCPGNLHTASGSNNSDSDGIDNSASLPCLNSVGVKEDDKKDCNMEVTSSNQCSRVCRVPAVEPIQNSWHDKRNSQTSKGTSSGPCYVNNSKTLGKENVSLTWQRTGRYIGSSQTDGRKIPDPNHLYMDAASSTSKHRSSEEDVLFPTLDIPHYSRDWFQQKSKYLGINAHKKCGNQEHVFVQTGDIHARPSQCVSRLRKDDFIEKNFWNRSKKKLIPHFKEDNANHGKKGLWVSKSNPSKPGTREAFLNEINPNDGATTIKDVKPESIQISSIDGDKSSVSSGFELPYHSTTREVNSKVCSHRWIPVGRRDSKMLKNSGDNYHTNTVEVYHNEEVANEALHVASTVLDICKDAHNYDCLITGGQGSIRKDKKDYSCAFDYISKQLHVYICSDLGEKTLEASYTSQIVSESFHLATGSPIAEFEKVLYSASPVVARSDFQQYSDNMVKNEPSSASFSKFLKPSIALREIWNWYEGPGNFGLQVKAEDFRNPKGSEVDDSFFAHFVPFLSAVQLFGRPYHSLGSSSENTEDCLCPCSSVDISSLELVAETSPSDRIRSKKCTRPRCVVTAEGSGCSLFASSVCPSDDSHVIFEYFEHEPPQQRKPLFAKIKELVKFGASSSQIYGDPSKLESMNLQDLHPASWYSVAWYPIYRIPEGYFRASFLTYHSLGHLHLRCTKFSSVEENAYCVVYPSLGMQSYNAQGECWFYPKKPGGDLQEERKLFNASELFRQRLRTLEESAALFSRGHVRKDHVTVSNRHPDYEFFLSRKH